MQILDTSPDQNLQGEAQLPVTPQALQVRGRQPFGPHGPPVDHWMATTAPSDSEGHAQV